MFNCFRTNGVKNGEAIATPNLKIPTKEMIPITFLFLIQFMKLFKSSGFEYSNTSSPTGCFHKK